MTDQDTTKEASTVSKSELGEGGGVTEMTISDEMRPLLSQALRSLCLTRDYVGEDLLPAIDGWEWYEAGKALSSAIPNDEWAEEFRKRVDIFRASCA